jgi:predicted ATPase/DNA-binding SARP family transcriptional activator
LTNVQIVVAAVRLTSEFLRGNAMADKPAVPVPVPVSVRVLGEIAVDINGSSVALPASLRAVALLGWLATHSGPRPRSEIASSLWPDVPDSSARNSVRSALWSLRQAFKDHADAVLDTSRNRLGLRNVSVDYRQFEELVDAGRLDDALGLAAGELLAGLDDEWAILARQTHRDRLITLLAERSNAAAADGNHSVAIARARTAAELNPLSESCARLLMRRYDEAADRSVALEVYSRIVDRLRHELKIAPSEETWRLAEMIRTRQHGQTQNTVFCPHLPVQLTSFVGRDVEIQEVQQILADDRLVTLIGAGGVGKTRLAMQVAATMAGAFGDDVWYVDLAPITDPKLVPVAVARALGLPDQPGCSTMDTLTRFIGGRQMLAVLDNCEHLLDATAALVSAVLAAAPGLALVATSREPIGVAGEVIWRVPSLSLADEAIELFTDRARHVRPDFAVSDDNAAAVAEICQRLDGIPLAIELAAARLRALSLAEIVDGLHDRFGLLTGGARTAVRRQQTLRASVDWSHALLTEPERVLLRRLSVFLGGFDLDAAQAVAGSGDVQRHQVLDQLTLLVDKSMVVAEDSRGRTRYRLLETVRQYALEKLGESGEADAVRVRHRDHYTAMAAQLDTPPDDAYERRITQADTEIDNLRAAFTWSRENSDSELAMQLASSLQPLWVARGIREGSSWFDAVLTAEHVHRGEVAPAVRARALADKAVLDALMRQDSMDQAEQALAIARGLDDPALLARALIACGSISAHTPEIARPYFAEAIPLARARGDRWMLSQILFWQAYAAATAGDPFAARAAAEEGRDLADAIGDRVDSRQCRVWLGWAQIMHGDLGGAVAQFGDVLTEADAAHDVMAVVLGLMGRGYALAYQGDTSAARAAADAAVAAAAELGGIAELAAGATLGIATIAAGDVLTARDASEPIAQLASAQGAINAERMAQAVLVGGDLPSARRWADDAVSMTTGWHHMLALTTRARVTRAQGESGQAEGDIHDALVCGADIQARTGVADIFECLADLACDRGSPREATRLFGAAHAIRQRIGEVRFQIHQPGYDASVAALRQAMGEDDFTRAWDEGTALSTNEAIAYAQRGHGERKHPTSRWAALTTDAVGA